MKTKGQEDIMREAVEPTQITRELLERTLNDPVFDWQDRQDFEFAARGRALELKSDR